MKFIAYLFLGIIILSVILTPAVELLCLFGDLCTINSVLISSSRAAVQMAAEESHIQDAEASIKVDSFEALFKVNFCEGLNLEPDIVNSQRLKPKDESKFKAFNVTFKPEILTDKFSRPVIDSDGSTVITGCDIEVTTEYRFKTQLMKKYVEKLDSAKTPMRLKRHQTLRLDF